jgi:hypothetical protein
LLSQLVSTKAKAIVCLTVPMQAPVSPRFRLSEKQVFPFPVATPLPLCLSLCCKPRRTDSSFPSRFSVR